MLKPKTSLYIDRLFFRWYLIEFKSLIRVLSLESWVSNNVDKNSTHLALNSISIFYINIWLHFLYNIQDRILMFEHMNMVNC